MQENVCQYEDNHQSGNSEHAREDRAKITQPSDREVFSDKAIPKTAVEITRNFELNADHILEQRKWLIHKPEDKPPMCLLRPGCNGKIHRLRKCPEPASRRRAAWKEKRKVILEKKINSATSPEETAGKSVETPATAEEPPNPSYDFVPPPAPNVGY